MPRARLPLITATALLAVGPATSPDLADRDARGAAPPNLGAFCETEAPNSTCHQTMVREGLGFLRPWVRASLATYVLRPDNLPWYQNRPRYHFDDCDFDGGTQHINAHYLDSDPQSGVVAALAPRRRFGPNPGGGRMRYDYPLVDRATWSWAWALHAAQDFYAHSNWVEILGGQDSGDNIIDPGLGPWRELSANWGHVRDARGGGFDDVLTSQKPMRSGWARLSLDNFVPIVIDPEGHRHAVLISGEAGPLEACPSGFAFTHDMMNKDRYQSPSDPEPGPRVLHRAAAALATRQTRHEWCRLLHLALRENGPEGAAVLLGLLADPRRSPHPPDSRCAEAPPGRVSITVAVDGIRVLRDKEEDTAGQLNFVFTLFTADMRRSSALQVDTIRVESGGRVPAGRLPGAITLCVRPEDSVIATVQAWEDDDEDGADKGRAALTGKDDLLSGVTFALGPAAALRDTHVRRRESRSDNEDAPDLRVGITIGTSASGGLAAPRTPPFCPGSPAAVP
jgi:hypothetical protein